MTEQDSHKIIYDAAKKVYERSVPKNDGINNLVRELNMNRGSAQMIILQIFPRMLSGDQFTRTLSVDLFDSFLRFILEDYGAEQLKNSLCALKKHIDYIKEKGDAKIKLRKVYQRYLEDLSVNDEHSIFDKIEQQEIENHFKGKTKVDLTIELDNSKNNSAEKITVNHKEYKRNNKIIALIKILRSFKCQICGQFILKRDGSKYIEAAHIIPKNMGGNENPENIILLCPNHHKEFDLGNCEITKRSNDEIEFNLNGKVHLVSLVTR